MDAVPDSSCQQVTSASGAGGEGRTGNDGTFIPTEDGRAYAGVPDAFQRLWTPHRQVYISGESRPATASCDDCPFCQGPKFSDEQSLIVYRGKSVYVLMNLFPYNAGHLLVCPYRHISNYIDLTVSERAEFGEVTAQAVRTLQGVSRPQGFNLGMNQGQVAGAGIAQHLHQHIVPRWGGDANFFPIIAQTKAISQLLSQAREQLAAGWADYSEQDDEC